MISIKSAVKDPKYNLKMILGLFLLLDLFLLPIIMENHLWPTLFYFAIYQVSLLVALMYGLRGQGKYKEMMFQLATVARNLDMDINERDTKLVSLIHHACLELGYIYEERNKEYGINHFTKKKQLITKKTIIINNKKKVKNQMEITWIDETVWKQVGYAIVAMWGFLGFVMLEWLHTLGFSAFWIIALVGIWYVIDTFVLFYIHYVFKLPQPEAKPIGTQTET